MKRIILLVVVLAGMALAARVQAAPFTAGDLVIYRVGDGVNPLASTGSAVFVDEYTTSGTLVQSIPMPTNQVGKNYPFASSGVATSEGGISLSVDGQYLLLQGYATNTSYHGGSLAGSLSTIVPRVVGRVDFNGNTDTSTVLSNWVNANNPRSVVSSDGMNLWVGGAGSGVGYTTLGSNDFAVLNIITAGVTNKPTNAERLGIFNGQLYLSTAKTTNGIYAVGTGLPTTTNQPIVELPGLPGFGNSGGPGTGNPYSFVFLSLQGGSNADTLYYADDGGSHDLAGIYKFSLIGGTNWVENGLISTPNTDGAMGASGLVGQLQVSGDSTSVVLFATSGGSTSAGGGDLFTFTDSTGYNGTPSGSAAVLTTAGANTSFRDLAFAPVAATTPGPTAAFRILSITHVANDISITWTAPGGTTNAVQAADGTNGIYGTNNFTTISGLIINPGTGGTGVTNIHVDSFGATNTPARYYRVRQVP